MRIDEPRCAGERPQRFFRAYGCTITSDIDLSFPTLVNGAITAPDVQLRQASSGYEANWEPSQSEVISRHEDTALGQSYVSARTSEGYRIRFDGLCEFDLTPALDRVVWRIASGADIGLVPVLFAGAVMTFMFMLAGDLVLHCSAVSVGGKGLAFVGRRGMGKSTMAALMCVGGGSLVTDDVGRVRWENSAPTLAVGGGESRLRGSASHLADLVPRSTVRHTEDDRLAVSFRRAPQELAPLDAIVIPMPVRDRPCLGLRALPFQEAVVALSSFPRLSGLSDRGMIGRQFGQIVDLIKRVPIFAADIPWSEAPGPRIGAELLEALCWKLPAMGDPARQGTAATT